MFKRIPVTQREWGLFGLRWFIPAALLIATLFGPEPIRTQMLIPMLSVSVLCAISNLLILILLIGEVWMRAFVVAAIILDTGAAIAATLLTGGQLAWVGLVPTVATGIYFPWSIGLGLGVGLAALSVLPPLLVSRESPPFTARLALMGLALLLAAPLASLLLRSKSRDQELGTQMRDRRLQLAAINRRASDHMAVVYEMAEVLSASRLDPARVLAAAVDFGMEGLQRVGVRAPLYGAVLLFAYDEVSLETLLRVDAGSSMVTPRDLQVAVPGMAGAIGEAFNRAAPVATSTPAEDPELQMFETFRSCKSVLCLPLGTGQESYGVMLVGSHEERAFKESHIDLMHAVANQTAASLHNAKLYVALREQRDRIVEVEKSARAQLAADLHDGPTQNVSAITMRLNYIRILMERKPQEAVNELYQIEDLARRTAKEIRAMLFELRPKSLEQGLGAGLKQLANQMRETYSQEIEVQVADQCDQLLDTHTAHTLFSIVVEAANNARKHAEASLIRVYLGTHRDTLVLGIADNGKGFDVEKALAEARQREGHLGLINLQERAALVEGRLTIDSAPGQGTRLTLAIPLETLRLRKDEEARRQQQEAAREPAEALDQD